MKNLAFLSVLLVNLVGYTQVIQNHYIDNVTIEVNSLKSGSCSSPDGPVLQISSPPIDYNQLFNNGYCNYSYPTTATFTACFTFISPGTSVSLNAGYSTNCLITTFGGFTLYNSSCVVVGTGLNFSGLTPGATYTWCLTMRAYGGPSCNGFTTFCPYFINTTPLPVKLLHFSIKQYNNTVELSWSTLSETNSDYFEIQKSKDATKWEVIGKVKGQGNSNLLTNYIYLDKNPYYDSNYYRLKQVDYDGNYTYTDIEHIKIPYNSINVVKIYSLTGQELDRENIHCSPCVILFDNNTFIKK
jgi:hypothetical protein